jgi:hypothetical protein
MEQLNNLLKDISVKCFRCRIKNEYSLLYKKYNNISITQDTNRNIKIYIIDKGRSYSFILDTYHYPFRCPLIFLNNKPYIDFLKTTSEFERIMLKNMRGVECFCCHSLNCPINWVPTNTLIKIIDEIYSIYQARKDIINKIIADKIKKKYLLPEIDLDCWLF